MHLIYIDDSGDEQCSIFSALMVPADKWNAVLAQLKAFRRSLKASDGIFTDVEFHATEFVAGRGRIADRIVTKSRRSAIFREELDLVAQLPGVHLGNACLPKCKEEWAFERLINRLNKALESYDSHGILICDEGKEEYYTRLVRRMRVHNFIPSRYGMWETTGTTAKNIPTTRILEDPVFRKSEHSYLIQAVDFCAFSLLRRERPTARIRQYGLDSAFCLLEPIVIKKANLNDPYGIIRL